MEKYRTGLPNPELQRKRFTSSFDIINEGNIIGSFDLASPGFHNALNATVAVAVAVDLGLSIENIKKESHNSLE